MIRKFKVILHQFPENSIWNTAVPLLKHKYDQSENNSFSNKNMISLKTIHSQTQI
jgi:hypothetical protein